MGRAFEALEPELKQPVARLYAIQQRSRWRFVLAMWLILIPLSLWGLRETLSLLMDYFTWAALRYGLIYNRLSALGIFLTLILTVTSAITRLRFKLMGYSGEEIYRLRRQVQRIQTKGQKHPLWHTVWAQREQS